MKIWANTLSTLANNVVVLNLGSEIRKMDFSAYEQQNITFGWRGIQLLDSTLRRQVLTVVDENLGQHTLNPCQQRGCIRFGQWNTKNGFFNL